MNKFAQLIGRLGYKFILSHKEHFIKALNKKIDIPFASEKDEEELEKNLNTTLLLNPQNEEALYMLIELEISKSNFSGVKELNEKFTLVCSSLCNKKNIIAEQIDNLKPENDKKE